MKAKLFFTAVVVATATLSSLQKANAQWNFSGPNIYNTNTGSIGIGTTTPWYAGPSTRVVQVSAPQFPQYLLQATSASANNRTWRTIARDNNVFQIQTLSDVFGSEQTAIQINRNANSITTVSFPNGSIGIGTTTPWYAGPSTRVVQVNAPQFPQYLLQATSATSDNKIWRMIARNSNVFQIQTLSDVFGSEQTAIQINRNANSITTVSFPTGNIGIGTNTPANKLDVCGTIRAKEVLVQTGWCDYVFDKNYKLPSLSEVEDYIKENKHLPGVTIGSEIETNGLEVGKVSSQMIKKIEELTLYVIEQQKAINILKDQNEKLETKISSLLKEGK